MMIVNNNYNDYWCFSIVWLVCLNSDENYNILNDDISIHDKIWLLIFL